MTDLEKHYNECTKHVGCLLCSLVKKVYCDGKIEYHPCIYIELLGNPPDCYKTFETFKIEVLKAKLKKL